MVTRLRTKWSWGLLALLSGCAGHEGTGPTSGPPPPPPMHDSTPPSTPANVMATPVSATRIDVAWSRATDNVGVIGYKVYRDGVAFRTLPDTQTRDTTVLPSMVHCYAVSAVDSAGNESGHNNQTCATTSNQAPVAAFTGPSTALPGTVVSFDASASRDPDGTIVSYTFRFGDGTPSLTQGGPVASHVYSAVGTDTVSVEVIDNFGDSARSALRITIGLALSAPVNVSNTSSLSQSAATSSDATGGVDVVWEEAGNDILFSRSPNGGASFTAPRYVIDPHSYYGSYDHFGSGQMEIATGAGAFHVAWTIFDLLSGGAEIFYARSTDQGATFSPLVPISRFDSINSFIPAVAADPAGRVAIAWAETDFSTASTVQFSASIDTGTTFSAPIELDRNSNVSCPATVWSSGNVYVAWTRGQFGQEEIRFARSTNGGTSFEPAIVVDHLPSKSWCPHLALDATGGIYIIWEEGDAFINRRIQFAESTDLGVSFSSPAPLSSASRDATCPALMIGVEGTLYATWLENDTASHASRSVLVFSSDGGANFSAPLELPSGSAVCPNLVSLAPRHIGLVWTQPTGSTSDIVFQQAEVSVP